MGRTPKLTENDMINVHVLITEYKYTYKRGARFL